MCLPIPGMSLREKEKKNEILRQPFMVDRLLISNYYYTSKMDLAIPQ